ncbi:MAG: sensor histidine kinase [Alloprevotella sp.]
MVVDSSTRQLLRRYIWLFLAFAIALIGFQWQRERIFRREALEARLEGYADVIAAQDSLAAPLSMQHLRTTVLTPDGTVLYESESRLRADAMQNHLGRPEVKQALKTGRGYDIRQSMTTGEDFFYYAKRYDPTSGASPHTARIVRVALPYNASVSHNLHTASNVFFWFALLVFAGMSLMLIYTGGSIGESIRLIRSKEKERTQEVKRQISTNIAHELRTPVAAIRGYLETLTENPHLSDERKAHFIQRALMQTERLTELIRDVSIISKTEASPHLLRREPLRLADVVREVIEELQPELQRSDIHVRLDLPAGLTLRANYTLLHAIFRNLLENSIRYAGHGVEACLTCSETATNGLLTAEKKRRIVCSYYDTGHGVGDEHLERIFERFYRIDEGRTRDGRGGTGLGLSIVRNAVIFHGGDIRAHNRPEGGLQFDFSLLCE